MSRVWKRVLGVSMTVLTVLAAGAVLQAEEVAHQTGEAVHVVHQVSPAAAPGAPAAPQHHNPVLESPLLEHTEHAVKLMTIFLSRLVEMFAGIIIGVASFKAIWAFFRAYFSGEATNPKPEVRITLGRALALALELELGADILGTAVAPTWEDIGKLAAIAVLRTALNYFLEREMRAEEHHQGAHIGHPVAPGAHPPID